MRWSSSLKSGFAFLILVALHYTLRPLIGTRVSVDFLVIAVLLLAVRVRPAAAAAIGFATGLITDSLTPLSFGAGALGMSIVGFAASWLKAVFFGDNVLLHAVFFAAGKWVFDLLYLLVARIEGGELLAQLFLWSPLSAVLTGLAGLVVVVVFRLTLETKR